MSLIPTNKESFKRFDASSFNVGIVVALFNPDITSKLLDKALRLLKDYKIEEEDVVIREVAGSIEIPVMLQALAETKKFDCLVALGAVIKGETNHYEYVCRIVSEGVLRVQLDYKMPIGFGVLTTSGLQQAKERLEIGASATEAALQLVKEIRSI